MTKSEFMRELTSLLSRIPEDERNDALQYYEDYFAEAGITDEMLVPISVGTAKQVADKIIGEAIYGNSPEQMNDELEDVPEIKSDKQEKTNQQNKYYYNSKDTYSNVKPEQKIDNTKLILGLVILIATFPVWSGVVLGIAGTLFGILAGLAGMTFGFGVAGITIFVTVFMTGSVASAILLLGISLLMISLAIISSILLGAYCGKFIPWLIRKIVEVIRSLFGKKECA